VAERHKLISLVYAILDIQKGRYGYADVVTYSGPTFIRVHSSKHDSSTAYSHDKDFDDLMNERKLHNYTTTIDEQSKPVVVLLTDSGPDENSHYKKTVRIIIEHFDKYDLDIIIVACFALHQNASNPLRTNNKKLEKRNFKAAGDVHYCPNKKSESWIKKHVMTCRYFTQVTKYNDRSCCKPFHSEITQILPNWFFPPSLMIQQNPDTICMANISASNDTIHFSPFILSILMERKLISLNMNLRCLPFDWYCLTVNKLINEYICLYCNWYFALKGALKNHTKKCSYKKFNLSHGEFLISNKNNETIWVEEEAIPEDVLETYNQQVQVQEE
ncbi:16446_t:CDS:2, partial [Cetraspora pellucida]